MKCIVYLISPLIMTSFAHSPPFSYSIIKTLLGQWCTSRRFHELEYHHCLFGCPNMCDDFAHYMECPILWRMIRKATGLRVKISAKARLGLLGKSCPSHALCITLFLASSIYHAVRLGDELLSLPVDARLTHCDLLLRRLFNDAKQLHPGVFPSSSPLFLPAH